jgi:nucleoside-diphosphate-sugar epimerase
MAIELKKVLVTGGAGFIGSHLATALVAEGSAVTVLDNLSSGRLSNLEEIRNSVSFLRGDIRDQETVIQAAQGCDTIFHLAAVVSVPQTINNPLDSTKVNDLGTLVVLEAARQNNVKRVVFASSAAVYGDDPQLPKHEDMKPKPLSPYAVQKLTGEYYCCLYSNLYGIQTICLRLFNIYGPRQDSSSPYSGVISIFMTKAVLNKPPVIYGDGRQSRDFLYVKDAVKAFLSAARAAGSGEAVLNVGTGKFITIKQLWGLISGLSGFNARAEYQKPRPGDIPKSVANVERARTTLGFEPDYSIAKGLEVTFDWYRKTQCSNWDIQ